MDLYRTLFDPEVVLRDYIESVTFDAAVEVWVEALQSFNVPYEEVVVKTTEKFKIPKWWAEHKVKEYWNEKN